MKVLFQNALKTISFLLSIDFFLLCCKRFNGKIFLPGYLTFPVFVLDNRKQFLKIFISLNNKAIYNKNSTLCQF